MKYYLVQIFLYEYVYKSVAIIGGGSHRPHPTLDRKIEHTRVRLVKAERQIDAFEAVKQLVEKSKVVANPFRTYYNFDGVNNAGEYMIQVTVPIVCEEL